MASLDGNLWHDSLQKLWSQVASIKQSVGLQLRDVRLHSAAQPFEHNFAPGLNVVLGANRSGKTDLCRLVAGLPTVASGEVWLHGQAIASQPTRQRSVAYVYQAFVNYPNLTVADNIMSPLVAQGQLQRAQMRELAEDLARRLGIAELMRRYPAELSGGQQQRVAIARALAKQADVLLLDEPLVNLDFKLRESLTRELREILKALGTIVIYTSSDRRDALGMADELLVLDGGEYIQAGVPMQVYTQPRNMAAMSIMSDPQVNPWQQGALRPEHVLLQRTAEVDTDYVQTHMDVQGVETNGSETLIFGQVEGHLWVINQPGMVQVDVDAALPICFRADDVVSFSVPG